MANPTSNPRLAAAAKATVKPKPTPSPKKTLPSLREYQSSAAANSMSYKEYLDYFRKRGYK